MTSRNQHNRLIPNRLHLNRLLCELSLWPPHNNQLTPPSTARGGWQGGGERTKSDQTENKQQSPPALVRSKICGSFETAGLPFQRGISVDQTHLSALRLIIWTFRVALRRAASGYTRLSDSADPQTRNARSQAQPNSHEDLPTDGHPKASRTRSLRTHSQPPPQRDLRAAGRALRRHSRRLHPDPLGQRQGPGRRLLRRASAHHSQAPSTSPTHFSKIAKDVGPAVVNINTVSIPKQSANRRSNRRGQIIPFGGNQGNQGDQGDMQDFFNRFFGGQGGQGGDDGSDHSAAASARPSAPASSSTRAATSSPTTTSSTRPTRSTSSSPPIPTTTPNTAVRRMSSASTPIPTSPSSRSTRPSRCPPSSWATPTARRSATGCSPSAARSPSPRPSPRASSPPRTAPSTIPAPTAASTSSRSSSRPTPPSTRATPAARWSIWPARSSA